MRPERPGRRLLEAKVVAADGNGDGRVDLADFAMMAEKWGHE